MKQSELITGKTKIAFRVQFRSERQVRDGDRMPAEVHRKTKKFLYYKSPVEEWRHCLEFLGFSNEFLNLPVQARDKIYVFVFDLIGKYRKKEPADYITYRTYSFGWLINEGIIELSECCTNDGYVWTKRFGD